MMLWLELNRIGVWWWDWEVLGVVVEGAVGDVGFGGVPHVFCETQGRGRTGACRWMRCAPGPDRGHKDRSRPWGGGTWRCPGPLRTSSPHRSRAPGDPFMRVICSAFWFHGVDLPAFFQQIVGLAPDLGHPPGDGLLVAAPHERVGELEAHAQKVHEQQVRKTRTCTRLRI